MKISERTNVSSAKNTNDFTLEGLLQALGDLNISGYFYTRLMSVNANPCVFSKFISPQLFMHMDNSKNINSRNCYSRGFRRQIIVARQCRMVPFP